MMNFFWMKIRQNSINNSILLYFFFNNFKRMDDTIVVEKDASIGEIDRKWFEETIGASLDAILKKNETSHEV